MAARHVHIRVTTLKIGHGEHLAPIGKDDRTSYRDGNNSLKREIGPRLLHEITITACVEHEAAGPRLFLLKQTIRLLNEAT